MDNLEKWEVIRLSAYNVALLGGVFFLTGTILSGSTLGVEEPNQSLLILLVNTFQDIGTVSGIMGGVLAYWTGG